MDIGVVEPMLTHKMPKTLPGMGQQYPSYTWRGEILW